MEPAGVGLADAVETIRRELEEAIKRGQGSSVAFEAGLVEMEFDVDFTVRGTGEAGIKAWVVSVSAKADATRSSANRVKIVMQPVDRTTRTKTLIGEVGPE